MPWSSSRSSARWTAASAKPGWPSTRPTTPPTARSRAGELQRRALRGRRLLHKIDCFCFTEQVLQPGETGADAGHLLRRSRDRGRPRRQVHPHDHAVLHLPRDRPARRQMQAASLQRRRDRQRTTEDRTTGTPHMAHEKNHDYHILPPSIWPLIGALGAFIMLFGAVLWMPWHAALDVPDRPRRRALHHVRLVVRRGHRKQRRRSHPGRADRSALRLHPVHHVRGDVLRGLVLVVLQARACTRWARAAGRLSTASGRPQGSRPSIRGTCR